MKLYRGELVANRIWPSKVGLYVSQTPTTNVTRILLVPNGVTVWWHCDSIITTPDRRRHLALYCVFAGRKA